MAYQPSESLNAKEFHGRFVVVLFNPLLGSSRLSQGYEFQNEYNIVTGDRTPVIWCQSPVH